MRIRPGRRCERSFVVTPAGADGFVVRQDLPLTNWRWRMTLPDGRAYRVVVEPHAGYRRALVELGDGTWEWVSAAGVCGDADLLIRLSPACR